MLVKGATDIHRKHILLTDFHMVKNSEKLAWKQSVIDSHWVTEIRILLINDPIHSTTFITAYEHITKKCIVFQNKEKQT